MPFINVENFLKICHQFQLGHLTTETPHPLSKDLSSTVKKNILDAIKILQKIDTDALDSLKEKYDEFHDFHQRIQQTLGNNKKVFLCGCGATGRLSMTLETLFRKKQSMTSNQVVSFMAGGDFALIKSVESFEDRPHYGARQLKELGFAQGDMLIGSSEGGETPFVIGALEAAAKISDNVHYFVYCNDDQQLLSIERSRAIIENKSVQNISLPCGPMAISGSTRMQASTVLMYFIGQALLNANIDKNKFIQDLEKLINADRSFLAPYIEKESKIYQEGKRVSYFSDSEFAITILTDTTERSPTFNLTPFENYSEQIQIPSLSYLFISNTASSEDAWKSMLGRSLRCLNWEELDLDIGVSKTLGFDISQLNFAQRVRLFGENKEFIISVQEQNLFWQLDDLSHKYPLQKDPLIDHLILKLALNTQSTLVMGILERYQGNIMTWVKASNNKLIDRAARYIILMGQAQGIELEYQKVIEAIFTHLEHVSEDEPIVLKVFNELVSN